MKNKIKKDIKYAIGYIVPKTEIIVFFWIAYTLSMGFYPWLGDKMLFITWFFLTGNLVAFYSKRLQYWIKKKAHE